MKTRFDLFARCTPWLGVALLASTAQAAVQSAPTAALDPKLNGYLERVAAESSSR